MDLLRRANPDGRSSREYRLALARLAPSDFHYSCFWAKLYGPIWRVKLKTWLYTLPEPVRWCRNYFGVVIGEPKSESNVRPIRWPLR